MLRCVQLAMPVRSRTVPDHEFGLRDEQITNCTMTVGCVGKGSAENPQIHEDLHVCGWSLQAAVWTVKHGVPIFLDMKLSGPPLGKTGHSGPRLPCYVWRAVRDVLGLVPPRDVMPLSPTKLFI